MIGKPRFHEAACASTQTALIERADGLAEGAIVTTDHQTAGRGRLGRAWHDTPGTSVLCSVLLRPPPERSTPELSLVAAAAVAEAIESHAGVPTQIKWPNDVLLEGCKVAGILAERRGEIVVLGIGINVNQTSAEFPSDTRLPPCSLRSVTDREHDREALLATLLERLEVRYEEWRADGFETSHAAIASRNALFGRPLRVGDVAGTGGSIAQDGRLEIVTPAGPMLVESGEVEVDR